MELTGLKLFAIYQVFPVFEMRFISVPHVFRSQTDFIIRFLPRELKILPMLSHANIIEIYEVHFLGFLSVRNKVYKEIPFTYAYFQNISEATETAGA